MSATTQALAIATRSCSHNQDIAPHTPCHPPIGVLALAVMRPTEISKNPGRLRLLHPSIPAQFDRSAGNGFYRQPTEREMALLFLPLSTPQVLSSSRDRHIYFWCGL